MSRFMESSASVLALALVLSVCGCTSLAEKGEPVEPFTISSHPPAAIDTSELPASLAVLIDSATGYLTQGADIFEVWVCDVPVTTTAGIYQPNGLRLDLDPEVLARTLNSTVTAFFLELSSREYRPQFVAGGIIEMGDAEGPDECFAQAIDRATNIPGVIAIATAEHRAGESGGFGTPGARCPRDSPWPCSARETGRGIYLGASDFHPDWGEVPALDLLEHEIGHVLWWPHSGQRDTGYASSLDMMSNSAAPRDADPTARNAQGTLAINRVTAGWIPLNDVEIVPDEGSTVTLAPSQGDSGTRIAIIPLGPKKFLSVELLENSGIERHLPESGVTVTLIDLDSSSCAALDASTSCRVNETQVGVAPFDDLLSLTGDTWEGSGWRVTVISLARGTVTLNVQPM